MAGKGDKRRPREIDEKTFEDNWNRIFKKKKEVTLPTYDNKPNENMFDDLNLKAAKHLVKLGVIKDWKKAYENMTKRRNKREKLKK